MKPFFTFYGGKYRAAPHYPAPIYDTVVEPFAGSAGYSLRHYDRDIILFDRDPLIVGLWRFLQTATAADFLSLPDLRDGETVDDLDVPIAARHLIGFWLNKGCAAPCKRPSAWMREGLRPNCFWGPAIRQRLAEQAGKISHWNIFEGSYADLPSFEATWFVDPPYHTPAGRRYSYSDIDYPHLAEWVVSRDGQVIACEQQGASWLPFQHFRQIKTMESVKRTRVCHEVIYTQHVRSDERNAAA